MSAYRYHLRLLRAAVPLLMLAVPDQSAAQHRTAGGFWLQGGLGWGSLACEPCFERQSGLTSVLALGGTPSARVHLGASALVWVRESGERLLTVSVLTAAVRYYLLPGRGLFVTGGLGIGRLGRVRQPPTGIPGGSGGDRGFPDRASTGAAGMLGIGYDHALGGGLDLTGFVNLFGGTPRDRGYSVLQAGLGLTLR